MTGRVLREQSDDGVAVLTISQPSRRNAMTYPMMTELFDHLAALEDDGNCRVVILTGAEGTFCSGIDLAFLAGIPADQRGYPGRLQDDRGWWNLAALSKPVIAAIDGDAVGMGAEWTSMCDVRIGTTRCRMSWNFVHRGLVPDTGAGTWLLPRLIGVQPALRLLMSGDWLNADEAVRLGYLASVVPPDDLLDAAHREARRYLGAPPEALGVTKRLVYDGLWRPLLEHQAASREALLERFASHEHRRGITGFLERGAPNDEPPGQGS
jgi:enoyl-CoA hydratase